MYFLISLILVLLFFLWATWLRYLFFEQNNKLKLNKVSFFKKSKLNIKHKKIKLFFKKLKFIQKITIYYHRKKIIKILPETLDLLNSALKAGYSQEQAWQLVAQDAPQPLQQYLQKHFTKLNYNLALEEILNDVDQELKLLDFSLITNVISIQRQIGGSLSNLIYNTAQTIRERLKLQRDIKIFTSQGRLSGFLIAALWPISIAFFEFLSPNYLDVLWQTLGGQLLLGLSLILEILGFYIIWKIIDIKF